MTPVFHVTRNCLLGFLGSFCFGGFGRYERSKFLHQASLAAGGGILVNDAFFSSFVELADRLKHEVFGLGSTFLKRCAGCTDSSTGGATRIAVIDTTLFVLLISFDLRLNISQGLPPEYFLPFFLDGGLFYMRVSDLSRKMTLLRLGKDDHKITAEQAFI